MDKVKFDKATYSLALIDIDLFTDCLKNLEESLKDANENLDLILTRDDENLVPCLQKYSLKKFEDAKRYFTIVRSRIDRYRNKLTIYFNKNLIEKEAFNLKVKVLNELINEKAEFIDEQILKCENYIAKNSKEKNQENFNN